MIEQNAEGFAQFLGDDPYRTPVDVAQNPGYYGAPYDDMLGQLRQQTELLTRLVLFGNDERAKRPTQVFLTTVPFNTTVQFKTKKIVISVQQACNVGLVVGTGTQFTFSFAAAGTFSFDYFTDIGRGVDLAITVSAGTGSAYLIADNE